MELSHYHPVIRIVTMELSHSHPCHHSITDLDHEDGLVGAVPVQVLGLHHQLPRRVKLEHPGGELKVILRPLCLWDLGWNKI